VLGIRNNGLNEAIFSLHLKSFFIEISVSRLFFFSIPASSTVI